MTDTKDTRSVHERAREARKAHGWSSRQVANALGIGVPTYQAWEKDGSPLGSSTTVWDVLRLLEVDLLEPGAVVALRALWARWGAFDGAYLAALRQLTVWARLDDQLTRTCAPELNLSVSDSLASRGVPEDPGTVFAPLDIPSMRSGVPGSDGELDEHGARLAAAFADAWSQKFGPTFDPWAVADTLGVAAGRAPLGDDTYSVTARVGDGAGIVVNSDLALDWQRRALTHALVHLTCGHVLSGTQHPIPDRDDDSIYCCAGIGWRVCTLVEHTVEWLLDPGAAHAQMVTRRELDQQHADGAYRWAPEPAPEPVLGEHEEPGYWHAYDVRVAPVQLRRELGLRDASLLRRGPGNITVPARLARRWVATISRGFTFPVMLTEQFPFDEPGCPSVKDVEVAVRRSRIVREQLRAHNDRAVAVMFDRLPAPLKTPADQ